MNQRKPLIRAFTPEDQAQSRQLILDGLGERFPVIDPGQNPDLDDISSSYLDQNHIFLVVEQQGQIIGTGGLIFEGDGIGRIVRVSVASKFRRRGIAYQMVNFLIDEACRARLRRVVVETNHDWEEAIALYKRSGFSEYDRDSNVIHFSLQM